MATWQTLQCELDAWAAAGRVATLWWRDDDAVEPTSALDRLLAASEGAAVFVAVAVIPARAGAALARRMARAAAPRVVQHGYAHVNHAPTGERASELGSHRPLDAVLDDVARGHAALRALFAECFLPLLAPPWNRIDPAVLPHLPSYGLRCVSGFGARTAAEPVRGLGEINTHCDVTDWRNGRVFVGEDTALARLCVHLQGRRLGLVDAAEPTGLLTHHLALDGSAWRFVRALLDVTTRHRAARWLDPADFIEAITVPAAGMPGEHT